MADRRNLFHDILNNPRLFLLIRAILDGGQVRYLKGVLEEYRSESVLDVACGCGTFCRITPHEYLGIDYNESFIAFCRRRWKDLDEKRFAVMDASRMRFDRRFDTAIIVNSIHHFSDKEVAAILARMRDRSRRLVIVHDAVPSRSPVSKFFYRLDRGTHFRTIEEQRALVSGAGLEIQEVRYFRGPAGIYLHSTLICTVKEAVS